MSTDYNDIGKLLDHIHLDGFGYRSFRKSGAGEATAAAAEPSPPTVAAEAPLPEVAAQPATQPAAVPEPEAVVIRAVAPAPRPAVVVPMRVRKPVESVSPVAPVVAVQPSPAPSLSPIGATLDRLMRGSITDGAPRLHLQLELPQRPLLDAAEAPVEPGERKLDEVFRKLHAAVAAKPRVVSGKER